MVQSEESHRSLRDIAGEVKERPIREWFSRAAGKTARATGSPWGFSIAFAIILGWALSGPLFGFSDTWQLVINTGTTIVTFLMVFLIQNTQNKDTAVIHMKLNELVASQPGATNHIIDLEDMSEADLERLRLGFRELARRAEHKAQHGERMSVAEVARAIREDDDRGQERPKRRGGHTRRA